MWYNAWIVRAAAHQDNSVKNEEETMFSQMENVRGFYTLKEIAKMIGSTRRFLELRIADGELKVFRPSSRFVRVRAVEFNRWVEQFSSRSGA